MANILAKLRAERNITQQSLADSVQVTRQMISAIENGAQPSVKTAKKIAQELGIDWTLLFNDMPKEAS